MLRPQLRWMFNFASWEPSEAELVSAFSLIQPEERARLLEFKYRIDLRASLCGRLMLRKSVSQLTGLSNRDIVLLRSARGRPYVKDHPEVEINISHAGKYTVLAGQYSSSGQKGESLLGIDIMPLKDSRIDRTDNFFRLMQRQFTENEWKSIRNWPSEEEQLASFYRHWSLKESYVKAVGTGLNIDLRTIDFKILSPLEESVPVKDTRVFINGQKVGEWKFEEILFDNHAVAVATNADQNPKEDPLTAWKHLIHEDLFTQPLAPIQDPDPNIWQIYLDKEPIKPF